MFHDWNDSPVFSRLNTVITLRYSNARILLHRVFLTRFLDHGAHNSGSATERAFLQQFGRPSLDMSILAASGKPKILWLALTLLGP
jgi:hypothetical protein